MDGKEEYTSVRRFKNGNKNTRRTVTHFFMGENILQQPASTSLLVASYPLF